MGLADVIVIVILVLIPAAIGFIKPSRSCRGCGGNCSGCSKCSCGERKEVVPANNQTPTTDEKKRII